MKNFLINTLLVLSSLLTGLLVVEVLLSLGRDRRLELMGFYATPGEVIDGNVINRQGFAGDTVDHPKSPDTLRVLTLGGSVLFNRHMSERLKQALQASSPTRQIELAGGALRNHTSASSLIKYKYFFHQYDMDVVLIYEGINDLWMNHSSPDTYRPDYSHYLPQYRRSFLLDHCLTCRLLYNLGHRRFVKAFNGVDYRAEKSLENNLRELIARIRADGARPVLMTFAFYIPDNYTDQAFAAGTAGYAADVDGEGDYWPVEIWGTPDYVREGLRRHNAIVRKLAQELQVELIDQEALFVARGGDRSKLFGDVCHFSNEGVDFFVDNVARHFAQHPFPRQPLEVSP